MPNYDFSKLGKDTDAALAKEWGISKERVRQFRVKLKIAKYTKNNTEHNPKLIEILKKYEGQRIYASKINLELGFKYEKYNQQYILNVANVHSINVKFLSGEEHGYYGYKRKCRCAVCRAANNIALQMRKKYKTYISIKSVDYYVNYCFELYESDSSFAHSKFFDFMIKDLKKE